MSREATLAGRLGWRLAAVMLAAVVLAGAAVAWRTLATVRSLDDEALQNQARLVAGQLAAGPDGRPVLHLSGQLTATFAASDGESLFIVYDAAGAPAAVSDPRAAEIVAPFLPPPGRARFFRVPATPISPPG